MDKPRQPHVIRTWVVNKMRTPRHEPPVQPIPHGRQAPARGFRKPTPGSQPPRTHE